MNWTPITNALCDANGDFNVAECLVACGGLSGGITYIATHTGSGSTFDFVHFCTGLGLLATALGATQALRQDRQRLKDIGCEGRDHA